MATTISLPQHTGQIQRIRIPQYTGDILHDVQQFRTIKSCEAVTGALSKPSKMPGWSYSLPASRCRTGSKLARIPGTVCYGCYAADDWEWLNQPGRKSRYSNYAFPNVREAMERRLRSLQDPQWVPAMVAIIRKRCSPTVPFRWHDSGDIQSIEHLQNIASVASATPDVQHWIPTREYRDVDTFLERFGSFPANLAVRVSAHRIGEAAPGRFALSSIVVDDSSATDAHICPAPDQGGVCGDCRACWNVDVPAVAYRQH